jgi:hypothetical protein
VDSGRRPQLHQRVRVGERQSVSGGAQLQPSRGRIVRYAVKLIQSWLICDRSAMNCRHLQLGALYVVGCQNPMCFVPLALCKPLLAQTCPWSLLLLLFWT